MMHAGSADFSHANRRTEKLRMEELISIEMSPFHFDPLVFFQVICGRVGKHSPGSKKIILLSISHTAEQV